MEKLKIGRMIVLFRKLKRKALATIAQFILKLPIRGTPHAVFVKSIYQAFQVGVYAKCASMLLNVRTK